MCNYSEKTTNEQPFTTIWYSCFFLPNIETVNTRVLTDKNDGTIELALTTGQRSNIPYCLFHNRTTTTTTLFKKCLQGQVYRQPQNDCQGTGTSANNFGAQTFQWCPTNDTACEVRVPSSSGSGSSVVVRVDVSPAAISCNNDPFLGRKWFLFDDSLISPSSGPLTIDSGFATFYNNTTIWDTTPNTSDPTSVDAYTFNTNLTNTFSRNSVLKNTFNSVLCYSK